MLQIANLSVNMLLGTIKLQLLAVWLTEANRFCLDPEGVLSKPRQDRV